MFLQKGSSHTGLALPRGEEQLSAQGRIRSIHNPIQSPDAEVVLPPPAVWRHEFG